MEIIIHNQCPLTLSAGLWINIVLMAEEKPAIAISQQLGPAQEQRERRQQWVGVIELRHWMSLCSLPRGAQFPTKGHHHFPNTFPGSCSGASFSSPQPLAASLPSEMERESSPCRELSPWEALYSSVCLNSSF